MFMLNSLSLVVVLGLAYGVFAAVTFAFLYPSDFSFSAWSAVGGIVAFSWIFAEWLAVCVFIAVASWFKGLWRAALFLPFVAVVVVQLAQVVSLYFTQDYVRFEDFFHAEMIGHVLGPKVLLYLGSCLAVVITALIAMVWCLRRVGSARTSLCVVTFVFAGLFWSANINLAWLLDAKMQHAAIKEPPVKRFVGVFSAKQVRQELDYFKNWQPGKEDLLLAERFGIEIDPTSSVPFVKNNIDDSSQNTAARKAPRYNVLVFFVESLSARFLGLYNQKLADLTPNLNTVAEEFEVFDNYYNHTFPTIVGVIGQLCSMVPHLRHGDWRDAKFVLKLPKMHCLPQVLQDQGYFTSYFGPTHPGEMFVEEQMRHLGFEGREFYSELYEKYAEQTGTNKLISRGGLGNSDRQMLEATYGFLASYQKQRPFFLTVSTLDTHPGRELEPESQVYGDGKIQILNLVKQFDGHFGAFWDKFKRSRWYDNTIVILTGDHVHMPSVELKEVFPSDYKLSVFDKMTMLVRVPKTQTNPRNSVVATSLDLAPTILDLLDLENTRTSFLGKSLYGERPGLQNGLGLAFGSKLLKLEREIVEIENLNLEICGNSDTENCRLFRLLKYSNYLQKRDLWFR